MRWIFRVSQFIVRIFFRLLFRIEVQGREHIPRRGKILLAANHVSAYDPPLVGCFVPRVLYFLAKKELFHNPLLGALIRFYRAIPVDRHDIGHTTIRRINELLAEGEAVLLFPEGTRSRTGQIGAPRSGVGMIAAMNNTDIVPVRVDGLFGARGSLLRRPRIKIMFGPVISVGPFLQNGTAPKEVYREIANAVFARIRDMAGAV
ncbi:MAG: 1-acyl-sn-glycerol-3-phosphate acyltransferase [candidate division KSB1 bacterium]|nr:1-acyl-sn-glycerol-3-phosphate acyltransferase [candidate division KSB1 bacterium]MDZ7301005.1 1-acyl-sn-glycerol-3-phosphate acyltransferase [candidate division KSB1 bacterium]MDZ7310316.1 1-acyl-sn-glycerol-3-phosphate acyltransferase [candidate division KSB1 bacterium]